MDTQHANREHSEKVHAPTHIQEQHVCCLPARCQFSSREADRFRAQVNTDGDKKIFAGLNTHKDSVSHGQDSHKVVDKGEVRTMVHFTPRTLLTLTHR